MFVIKVWGFPNLLGNKWCFSSFISISLVVSNVQRVLAHVRAGCNFLFFLDPLFMPFAYQSLRALWLFPYRFLEVLYVDIVSSLIETR